MIQEEVIKTTKYFCDFCGEEIDKKHLCTGSHEGMQIVIKSLRVDKWYYGDVELKEICDSCNKKIINFLISNKMLSGGEKYE